MSTDSGFVPPPPVIRPSASAPAKPKPILQRIHMRASYRDKSIQIDLDPVSQEVYTWQALKSKVWREINDKKKPQNINKFCGFIL